MVGDQDMRLSMIELMVKVTFSLGLELLSQSCCVIFCWRPTSQLILDKDSWRSCGGPRNKMRFNTPNRKECQA